MERIDNPNNDEFISEWNKMIDKLNTPKKLSIFLRIPIIVICCILIGLIWILVIPYNLLYGMWFFVPLHSFDFIMQPYYWFDCAVENDFSIVLRNKI
jgi:hypothetical protein